MARPKVKGTVTGVSPRDSLDKLRPVQYTQPYGGRATLEDTKSMMLRQGIRPAYSTREVFHDRRSAPAKSI